MNYEKIYHQLIEKARSRKLSKKKCYIEKHHIVPLSEGGIDEVGNIVALTAREHYIAHLLLAKIYNDMAMHSAVIFMHTGCIAGRVFKFNSKLYADIRAKCARFRSIAQTGKKTGRPSPMLGKTHGVEAKEKISRFMKGFHWWNNGKVAIRSFECPGPGFKPGRLKLSAEWKKRISDGVNSRKEEWHDKLLSIMSKKEVRSKISKARSKANAGRKWWNDGTAEVFQAECPEGFVAGRISFKEKA